MRWTDPSQNVFLKIPLPPPPSHSPRTGTLTESTQIKITEKQWRASQMVFIHIYSEHAYTLDPKEVGIG